MKILRKFPYWYLIAIPVLMFVLGAASNQAVLIANHGKFPVMMNEAEVSLACAPPSEDKESQKFSIFNSSVPSCTKGGQFLDRTHSIMGPNSHLKALADIFDLGEAVFSLGDFSIMLGTFLLKFTPLAWLFLTIRKLASLID